LIERVRKYLSRKGLLYVGDCKMAALPTRAAVARAADFYLCPLPLTGTTAKEFPHWVEAAVTGKVPLQTLFRVDVKGQTESIGQGYEFSRTCQYPEKPKPAGEKPFRWTERVLLLHSSVLAHRQAHAVDKRLQLATDELIRLTPEPGRGRKLIKEEKPLQEAIQGILTRHRVNNCLNVVWERLETKPLKHTKRACSSRGRKQGKKPAIPGVATDEGRFAVE
jgi:transposase